MDVHERAGAGEPGAESPPSPVGRRSVRPLAVAWGLTLAVEAMLWLLTVRSPAITALVRPVYVVAALPAVVFTWRWVRPRQDSHRRRGDRRRFFRRSRKSAGPGS